MDMLFSMSMSMSMSNNDGLDCLALQQMWTKDPRSIEGSDLMLIKEYCDKGHISTASEVAEAMNSFETPGNPSIDEQFATMARDICAHASNETNADFAEIQAACTQDPRDDDSVVDAVARLSARKSPEEEGRLVIIPSFVKINRLSSYADCFCKISF